MQDEELQCEHSSAQNSADNLTAYNSENHQNQQSYTRKESLL